MPLQALLKRGFGQTERPDFWWVQPLLTFLGLGAFVVYSTWAALQGVDYRFGPYLSPMYSPVLMTSKPGWWPAFIPFSAALLILWAPGGFRVTCYYYRGAYYKAFWGDPPACAVGEPRKSYWGERKFPLILQNVHRYFLYLALLFLVLLAHDAWNAMWFANGHGGTSFGFGIGTLIMIVDPILLGGYTLGCHSLRHLVGGRKDEISKAPVRKQAYDCVTCFNRNHMKWAWFSLFWVMFTDVYVRLCAMGIWHDWRIH
ncbi:MAG: succinate dehydrogenase [Chloroflexota bacterium]